MVESVIIMGAAGRDFHNFNIYFKDNPRYKVIGFTAAQIPDIDGRQYPAELAGRLYPQGIKIYQEDELSQLIRDNKVDLVAFSYSDVPHTKVMHKAAIAMAEGADFILIGATYTMLAMINLGFDAMLQQAAIVHVDEEKIVNLNFEVARRLGIELDEDATAQTQGS